MVCVGSHETRPKITSGFPTNTGGQRSGAPSAESPAIALEEAALRLVGAVLMEYNDAWAVFPRRYFSQPSVKSSNSTRVRWTYYRRDISNWLRRGPESRARMAAAGEYCRRVVMRQVTRSARRW